MNEQDLQWIEHFKETLTQPDLTVIHNFSMDDSLKELTLDLGKIMMRDVGCNKSSEKEQSHQSGPDQSRSAEMWGRHCGSGVNESHD